MGVVDGRIKECGVLHNTAMKFRTGQSCPVKGGLPDPAHGKGAVAEIGKVKIRVVGYAVECHLVKVSFPEKVRGKARLCRAVIKPLIDDF